MIWKTEQILNGSYISFSKFLKMSRQIKDELRLIVTTVATSKWNADISASQLDQLLIIFVISNKIVQILCPFDWSIYHEISLWLLNGLLWPLIKTFIVSRPSFEYHSEVNIGCFEGIIPKTIEWIAAKFSADLQQSCFIFVCFFHLVALSVVSYLHVFIWRTFLQN